MDVGHEEEGSYVKFASILLSQVTKMNKFKNPLCFSFMLILICNCLSIIIPCHATNPFELTKIQGWRELNENSPFIDKPFFEIRHDPQKKDGEPAFIKIDLPQIPDGQLELNMNYFKTGPAILNIRHGCDPITPVTTHDRWDILSLNIDFGSKEQCDQKALHLLIFDLSNPKSSFLIESIEIKHIAAKPNDPLMMPTWDAATIAAQPANETHLPIGRLLSGNNFLLFCDPRSCPANFDLGKKVIFAGGLPEAWKTELDKNRIFQFQQNQQLQLELASSSKQWSDMNLCYRIDLLLLKETAKWESIRMHLESSGSDSIQPQHRTISNLNCYTKDECSPSTGGKSCYERISCKQCIQDVMPSLFDKDSNIHQLRVSLELSENQIGFLELEKDENLAQNFWSNELAPILSFLENLNSHLESSKDLENWKIEGAIPQISKSHSGVDKFGYERILELEPEHSGAKDNAIHIISLTSLWLKGVDDESRKKIGDQTSSDDSFTGRLILEADDRLKEIDLCLDVYDSKGKRIVTNKRKLFDGANKPNSTDIDLIFNLTHHQDTGDAPPALGDEYFRLRFELKLTSSKKRLSPGRRSMLADRSYDGVLVRSEIKKLSLKTLGFGDHCINVDENPCTNGGRCKLNEHASYICDCADGFMGPNCEDHDKCTTIYDGLSGHEHCKSLGAKCVIRLPEIRCAWDNDIYYKPKFRQDDNGKIIIDGGDEQPSTEKPPDSQSNTEPPKEAHAWVIAIIIIFLALVILLVIIILGMIQRLNKANTKLAEAQLSLYELSISNNNNNNNNRLPSGTRNSNTSLTQQTRPMSALYVSHPADPRLDNHVDNLSTQM